MSAGKALEALVTWFNYREFGVRDMSDGQVSAIIGFAELSPSPTPQGMRNVVGRFLNV